MFIKKKPRDKSGLETAIDELHAQMHVNVHNPDEYAKYATNLTALYKLREHDTRQPVIKPEVLVPALTNLAGIMIIVGHERAHVVTSKALSFVKQLR